MKIKTTLLAVIGLTLAFVYAAAGQATQPAGVPVTEKFAWTYSTDGGKTFAAVAPKIEPTKTVEVIARATFDAKPDEPWVWLCMELTTGVDPAWQQGWTLNGKAVEKPIKEMIYRTLPGLDKSLAKAGKNTLEAKLKITNGGKQAITLDMSAVELRAIHPRNVRISNVVLGWSDDKVFTLTCRTNFPAVVKAMDRSIESEASFLIESPAGLFHRFTIPRSTKRPEIFLATHADYVMWQHRVAIPPAPGGEKFTFAVLGDCRTGVGMWNSVSEAVLKEKPQFVVHTGDVVTAGANEWEWREQFTGPAAKLFAAVPLYCVRGNHEGKSPLYDLTINSPGKTGTDSNWFQMVGAVLMIGIDGADGWTAKGERMKWLTDMLDKNAAKAKFIFLFTHYPPYTSGGHGYLGLDGKPAEAAVRNAQLNIMPLLAKYKATAVIAGHDHFYERSQPDSGVTVIISGGGGAELRDKSPTAGLQNPFSKVWKKVNHYCIVKVDGDTCTLTAIDIDGKEIDSVSWKARK